MHVISNYGLVMGEGYLEVPFNSMSSLFFITEMFIKIMKKVQMLVEKLTLHVNDVHYHFIILNYSKNDPLTLMLP
jgi:hypothetical protein